MSGNGNAPGILHERFEAARREMVEKQLRKRGIHSARVLQAMEQIPRHLFVPPELMSQAYSDAPLPIGQGQTISQPYMVAAMADALSLQGSEKVLEIGAGSGYQAAVISLLARDVIAVEAQASLAAQARERLANFGYSNVKVEVGDGTLGWPAAAPFDAILVTAAAPAVPPPLIQQLADEGRLLLPVGGEEEQDLLLISKKDGRAAQRSLFACRFVPLIGQYGWQRKQDTSGA
jgi:protein-L-isoaspartate(D-aspartate) O-methyltransferase